MKTSNISRVSVETPIPKKAKFNLSHDVNTTYDWGSVQPLFGKMLLPDSSINVNVEQLTRLAPMVVPTFGRVKLKNVAHFVPIQEIFPNWQALLSQTKVSRTSASGTDPIANTYVPKLVPNVWNSVLSMFCLAGSKVNIFISGPVGTNQQDVWTCYRNTGTWSTPAGYSTTGTFCSRELLWLILGLQNSNSPTTSTLSDFNYTGYVMNSRRLLYESNGQMLITASSAPIAALPTISTMAATPLPNANGSGFTHSASNEEQSTSGGAISDHHIAFDGSDMIWEFAGSDPSLGLQSADFAASSGTPVQGLSSSNATFLTTRKIRLVFKLSSFGKRLRKILIGLGYDVNLQNHDSVSILPLVAFYKAWWDSYAPERYRNFYETAAWKLIQACMHDSNAASIPAFFGSTSNAVTEYFRQFMADLGTCFATEKMDVIAAATDTYYGQTNTTSGVGGVTDLESAILDEIDHVLRYPIDFNAGWTNGVGADGSTASMVGTSIGNSFTGNSQNGSSLFIVPSDGSIHLTQPQIDSLKKAYIMLNKSSVAGMKVEEILRVLGFGDYVDECKGRFINGSNDPIKISDVVATSDTYDSSTGDGAQLGQYGGRGLGVDGFQFSYNASQHGYLIVLSAIVPESGYINSPAVENEAIRFEKLYNPELDGLAYEAIQKKNIIGSTLLNDSSYKDTFGFLPTYTQWKFMSNKSNGDFSLHSMRNSMLPYTLDKYIPVNDVNVYYTSSNTGSAIESCSPTFKYSDLPNAGEDWRYINKFPWNGNFNRIFSAIGDGLEWSVFSPNNNAFLYDSFEFDNFMCHNVFTITYWAHMKPIEDSYGTYDSEHGAPNNSLTRA